MPHYILSPAAQKSLRQISQYTEQQFGVSQRKKYLKTLRDNLRELAKNPQLGKARDEIKIGYYSLFVEKHTIYYRIKQSHIEVIDVLHQSMEPSLHL